MDRYTSQQPIQPGPLATNEPIWNDISDTFSNLATQEGEKAGAVAGLQPNYTPGIAFTKAGAAFQDAAIKTHTMLLTTDVSQHVNSITQDIGQNFHGQSSLQEYNTRLKAYSDNVLQNTPAQSLPTVQAYLMKEGATGYNSLQNKLIKQQNALATSDQSNIFQSNVNDISNTAYNGDRATALVKEAKLEAAIKNSITTGTIGDAKSADLLIQNARKAVVNQYALGRFNELINNPQTTSDQINKYFDDYQKAGDKQYPNWTSADERATVVNKMQALLKAKNRQTGPSQQEKSDTIKNMIYDAKNGADTSLFAPTLARLQPNMPDYDFQSLQQQIAGASLLHSEYQLNRFDPRGKQMQTISTLLDPTGKTRDEYNHDSELANMLQSNLKKLDSDPVSVLADDPALQKDADSIKLTTITANPETDPQAYNDQLMQYNAKMTSRMLNYQKQMGLTGAQLKVFGVSNGELSNTASAIINAKTIDDSLSIIQGLQNQVGAENLPYAIGQLMAKGPNGGNVPVSYFLMAGLQNIPEAAPYAAQIKSAMSPAGIALTKSIDPSDVSDLQAAVQDQLSSWVSSAYSFNGDSAQYINDYQNAVLQYAKVLYLSDPNDQGNMNKASQDAANRLILSRYAKDGINDDYRVPKFDENNQPLDPNAVEALMQVSNSALESKIPAIYAANQNKINYQSESNFADAVQQGHWKNMPLDLGWIRVTKDGIPIVDAKGNDITIGINEVNNPTKNTLAITNGMTPQELVEAHNSRHPIISAIGKAAYAYAYPVRKGAQITAYPITQTTKYLKSLPIEKILQLIKSETYKKALE